MSYYDKLNNSLKGKFEKKAYKVTDTVVKSLRINPRKNNKEQQVFSVFLFGIINALAYKLKIPENEIQIVMIRLLIDKLNYSIKDSVEFYQLLLLSTTQQNDPIAYKIIQSGIGAYFELEKKNFEQIKALYFESKHIVSKIE